MHTLVDGASGDIVTIAFGCRAGRHRSVATVELVAAFLVAKGWTARIHHADLSANPNKLCSQWCSLCDSAPVHENVHLMLRLYHASLGEAVVGHASASTRQW